VFSYMHVHAHTHTHTHTHMHNQKNSLASSHIAQFVLKQAIGGTQGFQNIPT